MDYNTFLSLLITLGIGALTFFIKQNFAEIKSGIKSNAEAVEKVAVDTDVKIAKVRQELTGEIRVERERITNLKEELPFIYTTREDFIRHANGVDTKLSTIDSKMDKIMTMMTTRKGNNNES